MTELIAAVNDLIATVDQPAVALLFYGFVGYLIWLAVKARRDRR